MNEGNLHPSFVYLALFISILLSSVAQVFQKFAADQQARKSLFLLLSLVSLGFALLLWLLVLSVFPVSQAYPMLSLSYIVVMILARLIFKEIIPWQRWLGAAFIMCGISFLMRAG